MCTILTYKSSLGNEASAQSSSAGVYCFPGKILTPLRTQESSIVNSPQAPPEQFSVCKHHKTSFGVRRMGLPKSFCARGRRRNLSLSLEHCERDSKGEEHQEPEENHCGCFQRGWVGPSSGSVGHSQGGFLQVDSQQ